MLTKSVVFLSFLDKNFQSFLDKTFFLLFFLHKKDKTGCFIRFVLTPILEKKKMSCLKNCCFYLSVHSDEQVSKDTLKRRVKDLGGSIAPTLAQADVV